MTRRWFSVLLAAVVLAAGAAAYAARATDDFPHKEHEGLFPLCIGCHAGIPTGDEATIFPEAESCLSCHDGTRAPRIDWSPPAQRASNLRFRHEVHGREMAAEGTPELECAECHTQPGASRMDVEPPIPERCLACHAHAAQEHFVDAECTTCHVALAESKLTPTRLTGLSAPPSHAAPDFLAGGHAGLATAGTATCATCHVREQCLGCHVAVPAGSPVNTIPAGGGAVSPPAITARYFEPPSHRDAAWEQQHGAAASVAACGSCHTRDSCAACHLPPRPAQVAQLKTAREAGAPGVVVMRQRPASHASAFFATSHGPLAAARPQSCTVCHERRSLCASCHEPGGISGLTGQRDVGAARRAGAFDSPSAVLVQDTPRARARPPAAQPRAVGAQRPTRGFHPRNYMLRHSAEAYGRRLDCSSCHNTQRFCRDCHTARGTTAEGRLGAGFHDAEPVWLLRHGQAARQTLESCTSCHTQRDCMQCHSQLGAFRVNPHGPDIDLERAERVNPQICGACHLNR